MNEDFMNTFLMGVLLGQHSHKPVLADMEDFKYIEFIIANDKKMDFEDMAKLMNEGCKLARIGKEICKKHNWTEDEVDLYIANKELDDD